MFTKDINLMLSAGIPPQLRETAMFTYQTGSHYTCSPPVEDTDIDFYMYVNGMKLDTIMAMLNEAGWEKCTGTGHQSYGTTTGWDKTWTAARMGRYNVMVVVDRTHFVRCAAATELCKALNIASKDERVYVHQTVHIDEDKYMRKPTNWTMRCLIEDLQKTDKWDREADDEDMDEADDDNFSLTLD